MAIERATAAERLKERIYATLTMLAVVIGLAESTPPGTHSDAAWTIGGTAVGVWLATLVADQQSHRVVHHRLARGEELRRMLYTSAPLLLSGVGPLLFTALSALGAIRLRPALFTAVVVDLAELFGWGVISGVRMGGTAAAAVVAGLADVVVGAGIVAVKVWTTH
ncbi:MULTISPECIES: hypothetical protein [Streptomycetaceae]|uniref:Uncharacterized protein n=1 Tax=Streptantibioticus cattleyicolor (strain ATCC 35852 / DSM 46488 / JCM 4925 / NBRC 14057 / NRRL 8057) TaxID=1003195 RepID=F8K051_STREN|nr:MULTISPECIES: hypothetical protein [Streptomycetaceae]AEW94829.1 hypothetical protein SCATT_24580 [Streptantibioticus cattleyicolor NRRL 8057 = DSM 46488]MYS59450.1 hypothetical protein [Streptomyces sp. SID5468]CCB75185.1 Putative membrane protein (modular protein) [Streptantibioticus cattleyicolor NRRL 8057 = DSM 46488]